jgi:hypothetical protein
MCPGNSECRVFSAMSAGMKTVVAKNLENLPMFLMAFLTRLYEQHCLH